MISSISLIFPNDLINKYKSFFFLIEEGQKLPPSNKNLIRSKDIKDLSKIDKTDLELISKSFQSKEKDPKIEQQIITDYIEEQGLYLLDKVHIIV